MDAHIADQLIAAVLGFFAGIGATIVWYRARGYEVEVRKDRACGP